MINIAVMKVIDGPHFEIADNWINERAKVLAEIRAYAPTIGASPDKYSHIGDKVDGLHFPRGAPTGWRRMGETHPGFYRPRNSAAGKPYAIRLAGWTLPDGEELAQRLGLPPFFASDGGGYCSSATATKVKGVIYVEIPEILTTSMTEPGTTEITKAEYLEIWLAHERERLALATGVPKEMLNG